jgi:glycosyltransferase 2 family protein
MKKKVIAGLLLSALLVYLSIRGIHFPDVVEGFRTIRYGYIPAVLAVMFLMQLLRSIRWGLILRPLEKIDQLSLFAVTNVGFLAIIAIPARLGELARPYLITKKSHVTMSAALGTIFAERVLDSLTVLVIAVFVLFFTPLPRWLVRSGVLFSS